MNNDSSPPIRYLLFDLDGTLTDPGPGLTRCFAHALSSLGKPVPAEKVLHSYIGPPLQLALAEMLGSGDDPVLLAQAVTCFRERFSTLGMYENDVYPGIPEALTTLQAAGFTLLIATSKPTVYATEILRHFELVAFFKAIYGSELSGERIAKGDVIAYLLEQEGIPSGEAVMIGDRKHDILGAQQNGIHATVGVTYGYGGEEELTTAGADFLCSDPTELIHIASWFGK